MGNENWKLGNRKILIFSYFLFFVILASCGKKGEPTLKSYEKPDPPSNLRAIHRESEIILSWDFPKNKEKIIKGFYLVKLIGKGDSERIFLDPDKRSHIDREFTSGSQYAYKIISQNLKGVLSIDSNVIEIEPKELPPSPKKPLFKVAYDSLTLTWEEAGDGIFYNIYKSDKKGQNPLFPDNDNLVNRHTFTCSF